MISLKKILVPVDFSEPSKKAVTYGLTLAGQFNASLILAHIVPESSALLYAIPTQLLEIEKEQYAKAAAEIRNLVPSEYPSKVNLQTIVKIGNIEQELLGIVREESIDVVVMGTHGRRHLSRWFIGSVTEHMLRHVPVPVLTVSHVEAEKHAIGLVCTESDSLRHRSFRILEYWPEVCDRARAWRGGAAHCNACCRRRGPDVMGGRSHCTSGSGQIGRRAATEAGRLR